MEGYTHMCVCVCAIERVVFELGERRDDSRLEKGIQETLRILFTVLLNPLNLTSKSPVCQFTVFFFLAYTFLQILV